ncbi:sulfate permease [Phlyctema vagabunda]|uniref:Sulfate permease n=1 Tax=Phlyctema vagabunda TaxID=108571 RepID=A0ABR4PH55_9HELO
MGKIADKLAGIKQGIVTDVNFCRAGRGVVRGGKAIPTASRRYLLRRVPIVQWLPNYAPEWLIGDFISGVTVGMILIPQALAFALVAGVPLQDGLIATVAPPFLNFLMGTTKDISTGPTGTTGFLTSSVVLLFAQNKVPAFVTVAAVSFSVGITSLIFGLLNLGFLLDFLSVPIIVGFMLGTAMVTIFSQIPVVLGEVGVGQAFMELSTQIFSKIGTAQPLTIAIGIPSVAFLLLMKYLAKSLGKNYFALRVFCYCRNWIVLLTFTGISYSVNKDLSQPRWLIAGDIPHGLALPTIPNTLPLVPIFFLSFPVFFSTALEHLALAKAFSVRGGYEIDASQELVYLGAANIASGIMGGMPVGGNLARSAIQEESGAKTPAAGIFTTAFTLFAIFQLNTVMKYVPQAAIAAVIFVAALEVMPPQSIIGKYWKFSFADFVALIFAFNMTLLATAKVGVGLSLFFMLFYTMCRLMFSRPIAVSSSDLEGKYGTESSTGYRSNSIPSGIQVISFGQCLIFVNAYRMKRHIMDSVKTYYVRAERNTPKAERIFNDNSAKRVQELRQNANIITPTKYMSYLRVLVLDFTQTTFIDSTGVKALEDMKAELIHYAGDDVEIRLVGLSPAVLLRFQRCGWKLASYEEAKSGVEADVIIHFELLRPAIGARDILRNQGDGLDFGFDTGNVMMSEGFDEDHKGYGSRDGDKEPIIMTSVYTRNGRAYTRTR